MKCLRLASAARRDVADAVAFYEEQLPGLGADFYDEVHRTARVVQEHPNAYARCEGDVRVKLVKRFPYAVYYRELDDVVEILAVSHTARRPRY